MKIHDIKQTSTTSWSPSHNGLTLALGTVAGALDSSFSTSTHLEIVQLHESKLISLGKCSANARFNRIVWGNTGNSLGIIAGGLENGDVCFWDPLEIQAGSGEKSVLVMDKKHSGKFISN